MPWSTCAVVGGCLLHCLSVRDVGCGSRLRTDCSPARCRLRHARVPPGSRLGGLQYKGLLRSIADGVLGVGYVVAFSNDLADRAGEPSDRAGYLAAVASAALTRTFQIDANVGGLRKLGVAAGEGATSSPGVWQARGRCGRDGLWWGRGAHRRARSNGAYRSRLCRESRRLARRIGWASLPAGVQCDIPVDRTDVGGRAAAPLEVLADPGAVNAIWRRRSAVGRK